jgi:hypothetical protein
MGGSLYPDLLTSLSLSKTSTRIVKRRSDNELTDEAPQTMRVIDEVLQLFHDQNRTIPSSVHSYFTMEAMLSGMEQVGIGQSHKQQCVESLTDRSGRRMQNNNRTIASHKYSSHKHE